ncbi:acyl carrier protein [Falsiroseomonas sp.]|uniref:acyl carrier protein n=1 Tax=Falsiroseomonas sp. TaxID=2870721 RepID=UPI0027362DCB|nr:acyl carrier protein [Falsiroseomonas sp.]MDP3417883.1 acyl carrier protein [Falsiroseomonas sp.]
MSAAATPSVPDDTLARVTQLVVDHLGVEPAQVKPEASLLDELGADSLDQIELVMALEEEFGLEISDDEAEACATIQNVVDLIAGKRGGAA